VLAAALTMIVLGLYRMVSTQYADPDLENGDGGGGGNKGGRRWRHGRKDMGDGETDR